MRLGWKLASTRLTGRRARHSLLLSALLLGASWGHVGCESDDKPRETTPNEVANGADSGPAAAVDARVIVPIEDPGARGDGAILSAPDASESDSGAASKICGGIAGIDCAAGEFCNHESPGIGLGCGFPDSTGLCERQPMVCADIALPVCGCDGQTYANACEAHVAGVSVDKNERCAIAQGVDCDETRVACKKARPSCPAGQVPAVVETCWGECVPIDHCACSAANDCPEHAQYICHMSAGRCGPYVN